MWRRPGESGVTCALRIASRAGLVMLGLLILVCLAPWLLILAGTPQAGCSRWRAVLDYRVVGQETDAANALLKQCRITRSEGSLDRWETPTGPWWIPHQKWDLVLPLMMIQQRVKIYGAPATGDVVLDCGAHIGLFTRAALDAGAAKVVAIEPNPEAVECLRRNLSREIAEGRVVVAPVGVWDSQGKLTFYDDGEGGVADSFVGVRAGSKAMGEMPVTTIDALVRDLRLARVDFIKMDIKGATTRALRGGETTVRQWRPRLAISTEEAPDDPGEISAVIGSFWAGYRPSCRLCIVTADAPGSSIKRSIHPDVMVFR
jgi:FkbM family methyltransferase